MIPAANKNNEQAAGSKQLGDSYPYRLGRTTVTQATRQCCTTQSDEVTIDEPFGFCRGQFRDSALCTFGLIIFNESLKTVNKVGSIERIASNTDYGGLTQTVGGGLVYRLHARAQSASAGARMQVNKLETCCRARSASDNVIVRLTS